VLEIGSHSANPWIKPRIDVFDNGSSNSTHVLGDGLKD
jgi:hypothetical protein